jgi:uncharacterized protein
MLFSRALSVTLLALGLLTPVTAKGQLEFPQPKGWINDYANLIDTGTKKRLTTLCMEVDQKTHAQIAVVTIDSIGATPVGDYAHLLFNKWGIGHKEDNRGMLILLSRTEHEYYIAVGRGFEALFPNERVARIGAEMVPDLRAGRYSRAALHTADEIATIIANERGVKLNGVAPGSAQ